jgi:hypothetical protein
MNANPGGNPNVQKQEDSINALEQDLTQSGLLHGNQNCCKQEPPRIPGYNPYSSSRGGNFNHYETTKQDADKDIEMMLRMKNGQPGNLPQNG